MINQVKIRGFRNRAGGRLWPNLTEHPLVKEAFVIAVGGDSHQRRALPDPEDEAFAQETYEEPQGEIEQSPASIYSDLLKIDRVSRRNSFFALGGSLFTGHPDDLTSESPRILFLYAFSFRYTNTVCPS